MGIKKMTAVGSGLLLIAAGIAGCGGSSTPKADPKSAAFCDAYKVAQQAVDGDYTQHPELFQKAADIAPADIKSAADKVVQERQAAVNDTSTTQGALDGLTPSGITVQTFCMGYWNANR
jgi:hypothetical protein